MNEKELWENFWKNKGYRNYNDYLKTDFSKVVGKLTFIQVLKEFNSFAVSEHKREMGKLFEELEKVALSDGWDDGLDLVISSSDYKRIKEARLCEKPSVGVGSRGKE